MTDLKSIVEEHINIRKELKLTKLDDNTLFSEAVRRINTQTMDSRPQSSSGAPGSKPFKELNALATEGQIACLKKYKITIPAGLTKIDADALIKKSIAEKKGGNKDNNEEESDSYY